MDVYTGVARAYFNIMYYYMLSLFYTVPGTCTVPVELIHHTCRPLATKFLGSRLEIENFQSALKINWSIQCHTLIRLFIVEFIGNNNQISRKCTSHTYIGQLSIVWVMFLFLQGIGSMFYRYPHAWNHFWPADLKMKNFQI